MNQYSHGLGLSICQKIMHQMRGELSVISSKEKGSRFFFTLETTMKEKENIQFEVSRSTFKFLVVNSSEAISISKTKTRKI